MKSQKKILHAYWAAWAFTVVTAALWLSVFLDGAYAEFISAVILTVPSVGIWVYAFARMLGFECTVFKCINWTAVFAVVFAVFIAVYNIKFDTSEFCPGKTGYWILSDILPILIAVLSVSVVTGAVFNKVKSYRKKNFA